MFGLFFDWIDSFLVFCFFSFCSVAFPFLIRNQKCSVWNGVGKKLKIAFVCIHNFYITITIYMNKQTLWVIYIIYYKNMHNNFTILAHTPNKCMCIRCTYSYVCCWNKNRSNVSTWVLKLWRYNKRNLVQERSSVLSDGAPSHEMLSAMHEWFRFTWHYQT